MLVQCQDSFAIRSIPTFCLRVSHGILTRLVISSENVIQQFHSIFPRASVMKRIKRVNGIYECCSVDCFS